MKYVRAFAEGFADGMGRYLPLGVAWFAGFVAMFGIAVKQGGHEWWWILTATALVLWLCATTLYDR